MIPLALPYLVWVSGILLTLSTSAYMAPAYIYAGKTILCAVLFLALRPWRFAATNRWRAAIVPGLLIGVLVFVLWTIPEVNPYPAIKSFYLRWIVLMPGSIPDATASTCYAWSNSPTLAILKLIGSAFVIAPIEEYFFRGFLMRWLTQRDWRTLPLNQVSSNAFWMTTLCFAFEHDRAIAGFLAGMLYGKLATHSNSLAAPIIAHSVTNLLLGILVLTTHNFAFW